MRLKRPRPASPDQVRITREGETAVIEYADPSVGVVNLQAGPSLAAMTDAAVLELFNEMLEAQAEIAAGVDRRSLTLIPNRRYDDHRKGRVAHPQGARVMSMRARKGFFPIRQAMYSETQWGNTIRPN